MGRLDRLGARVPERQPRGHPAVPDHAGEGPLRAGPGLGVERLLRRRPGTHLRRLQLPRGRRPPGLDLGGGRRGREDRRHQGARHLHRDLGGLRPREQADLLHHRQRLAPRPLGHRSGDRQVGDAPQGRPDRRPRLQPGGPLDLGRASLQRVRHPGPHPPPLRGVGADPLVALRRGHLRCRHLTGRQPAVGLHRRDRRPPHPAGLADDVADRRRDDTGRGGGVRHHHPVQLRLLARWPIPLRQHLLHRGLQHLPLRDGHRCDRGGEQHRDRALPADPPGRRQAHRLPLHRRGLRARHHRGETARGCRADHLPRPADRREVPRGQGVVGGLAGRDRSRGGGCRKGRVPRLQEHRSGVGLPDHPGLPRVARDSASGSTSPTR